MTELGRQNIDSILLEGGAAVNASAIKAGIVSEIDAFIAPKLFGGGPSPIASLAIDEPSQSPLLEMKQCNIVGDDLLVRYRVVNDTNSRKGGC